MARRKYVKGALVEARNSKYGKGFGIIRERPGNGNTPMLMDTTEQDKNKNGSKFIGSKILETWTHFI